MAQITRIIVPSNFIRGFIIYLLIGSIVGGFWDRDFGVLALFGSSLKPRF